MGRIWVYFRTLELDGIISFDFTFITFSLWPGLLLKVRRGG